MRTRIHPNPEPSREGLGYSPARCAPPGANQAAGDPEHEKTRLENDPRLPPGPGGTGPGRRPHEVQGMGPLPRVRLPGDRRGEEGVEGGQERRRGREVRRPLLGQARPGHQDAGERVQGPVRRSRHQGRRALSVREVPRRAHRAGEGLHPDRPPEVDRQGDGAGRRPGRARRGELQRLRHRLVGPGGPDRRLRVQVRGGAAPEVGGDEALRHPLPVRAEPERRDRLRVGAAEEARRQGGPGRPRQPEPQGGPGLQDEGAGRGRGEGGVRGRGREGARTRAERRCPPDPRGDPREGGGRARRPLRATGTAPPG